MSAWRSFITTTNDLVRAIERDLHPFGLGFGDYQLLVVLSESPERRMKMCDLADVLRLSRGGLTRRMAGVLGAGLVERVPDEEDGRAAWARMTPEGFSLLRRAAPVHVRSVRARMIDLLTPAEIRAIGSAFAKVARRLDDEQRGEVA
jgi:DNA-binding MarR family transcriptional regulator